MVKEMDTQTLLMFYGLGADPRLFPAGIDDREQEKLRLQDYQTPAEPGMAKPMFIQL